MPRTIAANAGFIRGTSVGWNPTARHRPAEFFGCGPVTRRRASYVSTAHRLSVGAAFIRGDLDIEGDIFAAFSLMNKLPEASQSSAALMTLARLYLALPKSPTAGKSESRARLARARPSGSTYLPNNSTRERLKPGTARILRTVPGFNLCNIYCIFMKQSLY